MFTASSILFYHLLVFFFCYQSILLYPRHLLTLCPVTIFPLAIRLTSCISYHMLLTSLNPKHMYSYISENGFEPSNQIIVPTGYNWHCLVCSTTIDCCSTGATVALSAVQYSDRLLFNRCYIGTVCCAVQR